ncbi:unnamed protein product [Cylindrotheca closterium]|uniref:Sulfotransferase domain-containing protein n=1 Tax=Cylindrotheca closterium TaxID=2856 RepID=A0AAD2CS33_9STRA|nr:unnamed protein product [Cylindrotheca closterium]
MSLCSKSCSNSMRSSKLKTATFVSVAIGIYYLLSLSGHRSIIEGQLGILSTSEGDSNGDGFNREYLLAPEVQYTPKIAWLMSFPNSGTSFTMSLVGRASNRSFATNYADEVTPRDISSASLNIYHHRHDGPFWPGMSGKILSPRPLPESFVITKTHCGSRCMYCGPEVYVVTADDFLSSCSSGHARIANKTEAVDVHYPPERVASAIHLIRDPFTNIISRFHQRRKNQEDKNLTEWLSQHPNNSTGFQRWCKELDNQYRQEDIEYFGLEHVPKAPCHGEFFKYAQWHSLVEDALDLISHPVPVLTVYYEDYASKLEETTETILNFLDLDLVGRIKVFKAKTEVSEYFTAEQKDSIKEFIRDVASSAAWAHIQHYF